MDNYRKGPSAKRRKRSGGGQLQCSATRNPHDIPLCPFLAENSSRCALLHVVDVFRSGAERFLRQRGLRELIDIAVEHCGGVRG